MKFKELKPGMVIYCCDDNDMDNLLKENNQDSIFAKIAVCLLLDDHRTAKIYFKRVESQDDKNFFNQLPIHRFWK